MGRSLARREERLGKAYGHIDWHLRRRLLTQTILQEPQTRPVMPRVSRNVMTNFVERSPAHINPPPHASMRRCQDQSQVSESNCSGQGQSTVSIFSQFSDHICYHHCESTSSSTHTNHTQDGNVSSVTRPIHSSIPSHPRIPRLSSDSRRFASFSYLPLALQTRIRGDSKAVRGCLCACCCFRRAHERAFRVALVEKTVQLMQTEEFRYVPGMASLEAVEAAEAAAREAFRQARCLRGAHLYCSTDVVLPA